MDDTPFDCLILEIKLFRLAFVLLFSSSFCFLKLLFVIDSIDEERHFSILPVHLILVRASYPHDVFDFLFGKELFDLIEIKFLEHMLHDVVYSVSHYDN
jgi:hypothetical protein